jgi:tRNA-binding protein
MSILVFLSTRAIMQQISWTEFEKVELRVGTIVEVIDFPPSKKTSLQIKD